MPLTYRDTKGQALTAEEFDANTRDLDERPNGQVYPNTKGIGLKIDSDTPEFGWHDLLSDITLPGHVDDPSFVPYIGNIEQMQMDIGNAVNITFHLPHDYAPNTDIYIHLHWSHNSPTVTSGGISGFFEASYAKGHDQAAFSNPVVVQLLDVPASPIRYQHMVSEAPLSAAGGAGGLIATEDLEVDGLILCRLEMTGNSINDGAIPFLHQVDIHYQSTGLPTKNKAPDFWT